MEDVVLNAAAVRARFRPPNTSAARSTPAPTAISCSTRHRPLPAPLHLPATLGSHAWRTLDFSSCHAAALKFFAGPSLDARFRSLTELNLPFAPVFATLTFKNFKILQRSAR